MTVSNDNQENRPAIDEETIESLRELQDEGEPDLISELFSIYQRDAPMRLSEMEQALASSDAKTLERCAHTLKSASGNLGCFPMSELCAQLESLGRSASLGPASELLKQAQAEYQRILLESTRYTGGPVSVAV